MENILLIGGAGFLGKQLVSHFLKQTNCNIYIYDRFEYNHKKVFSFIGDVQNNDYIKKIIIQNKIDTIIYLVSTLLPASTYVDYITDINLIHAPINELLMFSSLNNIKFVFFSSGGTIYGSQSGILKENDKTEPISFYGFSKLQIEQLILFYNKQFGLKYLIIRPSNPYGFGQNINGKQGLIAVALGKIIRNEPVVVYGDGTNVRDYIFIEDFSFYVTNLILKNIENEIINIGSGIGTSINEVIEIIESVTHRKFEINRLEERKSDVKSIVMNIEKLNSLIEYKQHSLEFGIKDFYSKLVS